MEYISVKDAAAKFAVSERRIQQLCDAGRFSGAQIISGVWVIPASAEKPADDRMATAEPDSELISLNDLCKMLSISAATGRNWMKLGKLTPHSTIKKTAFFSLEYADSLKASLKKGENKALKSRRNKKYVSGSNIYNSYVSETSSAQKHVQSILDCIAANHIEINEPAIRTLVAECAVQLFLHDTIFSYAGSCLERYLNGSFDLNGYDFLIDDLITDKEVSLEFIHNNPDLFKITYQYEKNEDVLGLLFISTKNLGTRKATGSYYTPTKVVKRLCKKLFEKNDTAGKLFLDPCCGTGNFLLQLPPEIPFDNIHGNDTDLISVLITRINMAIKYGVKDKRKLYTQITNEDYLDHSFTGKYDFIIGNPPWGYEYTDEEKNRLRNRYSSVVGANIESYDIFIEQALKDLNDNGVLSYVLPEAVLNVKMHMPIRKLLAQQCHFQYLDFLGNAFDKVQCPCIILQLQYTGRPLSSIGMEICDADRSFVINTKRQIRPECFSFMTTDDEYSILNKIGNPEGKCFLAGNAIFALGIVTGNNKEYISTEKNECNEMVLKGSDLCKYRFNPTTNYIVFKPESFQQIAPTEYYRAPEKLLYRFICSQLVFAYDNQQTLSLNSCNLVIPQIEGLSVKYILAILNSRMAQYYFKKTFHSVKVLRSHIEQIPIPNVDKERQEDILIDVEELLAPTEDVNAVYDRLDKKISVLYDLSDREYQTIMESMSNENMFLK